MTAQTWHLDNDLAERYATGRTGRIVASSIEQHLIGCEACRGLLAPFAEPQRSERVWAGVLDRVQAPPVRPLERLLRAVGMNESTARLLTLTPSLRGSWLDRRRARPGDGRVVGRQLTGRHRAVHGSCSGAPDGLGRGRVRRRDGSDARDGRRCAVPGPAPAPGPHRGRRRVDIGPGCEPGSAPPRIGGAGDGLAAAVARPDQRCPPARHRVPRPCPWPVHSEWGGPHWSPPGGCGTTTPSSPPPSRSSWPAPPCSPPSSCSLLVRRDEFAEQIRRTP